MRARLRSRLGVKVSSGRLRDLASGAVGVTAMRVAAIGLSFVTAALLARLLGSEGYGIYAYTMAWVGLLVIPANAGLPAVLTRELAAGQAVASWGMLRGLLRWSEGVVLALSTALTLVAGLIAWVFLSHQPETLHALWLAFASLPFAAMMRLKQASLRGLHFVTLSQLPELIVRPVLLIMLVLLAYALFGQQVGSLWVIGCYTFTMALMHLYSTRLLSRALPKALSEATAGFEVRRWVRSAFPFLLINGMYVMATYTDTLMLGMLRGAEEAGVYAVVSQGAQLILFVVMSISLGVEPLISKFYAEGRLEHLQRLLRENARTAFLFTLPIAAILILFGHLFLAIFGPEFVRGRVPLIILSLGYLGTTTLGFAHHTLSMTKYERITAVGVGAGALLNVTLNALLIPPLGVTGAAVATAISLIFRHVVYAVLVRRKLRLNTTIFAFKRPPYKANA